MARPRIRPAAGRTPDPQSQLDDQQRLVLAILREARGAPVDYATLKAAGLEWPASVIAELELLGWPVERARRSAGGGPCVRLDPARDPLAHPPCAEPPATQRAGAASRPGATGPGAGANGNSAGAKGDSAVAGKAAAPPAIELAPQYRLYRARPWLGPAALLADTLRPRRARLASALIAAICVIVALALAGVFSGGAHASRTAARLGMLTAQHGGHRAPARSGRGSGGERSHDRAGDKATSSGTGGRTGSGRGSTTATQRSPDAGAPAGPPSRTRTTASTTHSPGATATQPTGGVAATPSNAAALEAQGHALLTDGDYGQAIPLLRRALSATGESTSACLQPATETCLTYAYALYDLATALRLSGDPAAAVPLLEQRLQIDNQRPVVAAELALARQQAGLKAAGGRASTNTAQASTTPSQTTTTAGPPTTTARQTTTTAGASSAATRTSAAHR
jgi:tetratricopeptide (TPR) repeat protein